MPSLRHALRLVVACNALLASSPEVAAAQTQTRPAVDRLFTQWHRADSPGCTLGVMQNGRFVYRKGYGSANLDYRIPNSPEMVYYVGSVSKQFTAAAVGLLAVNGRIGMDDDIRKYFPEMPAYQRTITIRQLVHHTSGLRDIYVLMNLAGKRLEDVFTDAEALALIAQQKETNFPPGDEHLYSNSGYFLLGQLVKRVTGQSLRVFADSAIFGPLGMTRTHFHDDPGHVMPMRAMAYEPDGRGGVRISYIQNFDKIGAGGLYSTLEDLRRWDENYYTHAVGGRPLQDLIHTRGVLTRGDTLIYAFGNEVATWRGQRTTEHSGALMGYKAHLLRFPDLHFSVTLLCNKGDIDPGPIAHLVAEQFIGRQLGPTPPSAARPSAPQRPSGTPATETALIGSWVSEEVGSTFIIRNEGNGLILERPPGRRAPILQLPDGTLRADGLTLTLTREGGRATSFTVEAGRVRNIRFTRR